MRLVLGCDEMVASWVGERLGTTIVPPYTAIGATKDGLNLCIGAVFNDYTGANIELNLASDRGFTRGFICSFLNYVFVQMKCNRLSAKAKRSNVPARKQLPKLGFRFEGISARYFGPSKSDDAIRYVMFPEDARKWLNGTV